MAPSLAAPRRILVTGSTGTIGRAVVRQCLADGHSVTGLIRPGAAGAALPELDGAVIMPAERLERLQLDQLIAAAAPEVIISCLASRSGAPRDAWAVDYAANAAVLAAAQSAGARQFILLSAICVQKPLLAFQHAKLAFEAELTASGIDYTIIRPTAFFKSLSGQVARVKAGKPFLIFGDGRLTRCKPISDGDLARFMVSAIDNPEAAGRILPIGGPGPAMTPRENGAMLFALLGREPRYTSVSPRLFRLAGQVLGAGAALSDGLAAKAEYARIAHYYATESMLVLDPASGTYRGDLTPEFGTDTLRDHYARLLAEA